MAPVTENAILPVKAGLDLGQGEAASIWRSTLDTIKAQPGCQRLVWGRQRENLDYAQMLVDWDSVDHHKAFIASPAYGPFYKSVSDMVAAPPVLTHHAFPSDVAAVTTSAPVTELISMYFPATYNTADFAAPWEEFMRIAGEHAKGLLGWAGAWAEEEVEHGSLKGEKGKLFLALVAWESVDAHMAYRETQAFKESIVKVRALVSGVEMHHVDFQSA
ncbi:hypothetical protein B0J12DRAFT_99219 [Macrophomina phaseolina]|uniref:ABM domain-containing protein n=1 Tax=Macrophomina phaseolina TaxID=35725 RepID=A0ABQ8G9I9_9PEZI|nr:hypothetical protein B0J12DRAFT_99219 [Macrophomina phaseolina]